MRTLNTHPVSSKRRCTIIVKDDAVTAYIINMRKKIVAKAPNINSLLFIVFKIRG